MKDDTEDKIKKYGTFFDSKREMIQLYILFIFFGVHGNIIKQFPTVNKYKLLLKMVYVFIIIIKFTIATI